MELVNAAGRRVLQLVSPGGRRARLLIFTFHRVLAEPDPLLPGEPSLLEFARQAAWIAEFCNVLPLAEAAAQLQEGALPPRAACITFDDGYADTELRAAPLLHSLRLPASVFVAVDAIRVGIMWNDLVLDAIRHAGRSIDLASVGISASQAHDAVDTPAFASSMLDALKYRPPDERWQLASALHASATGQAVPRRHMLSPDALCRLARAGFDIGAHTVSHPILTSLADAEARREIESSRDWIAGVTGIRPTSFAYPNGKPERDYDVRHVDMVRAAGFRVAVSTQWGCARRESDIYQLPRIAPSEVTRGSYLARLIRTCLGN